MEKKTIKPDMGDMITLDQELFLKMKANFWEREALQEKINRLVQHGQELLKEFNGFCEEANKLYGIDLLTTHQWDVDTGKVRRRAVSAVVSENIVQ